MAMRARRRRLIPAASRRAAASCTVAPVTPSSCFACAARMRPWIGRPLAGSPCSSQWTVIVANPVTCQQRTARDRSASRSRPAPGPGHADPRQREIATLAAAALTNKQIGERLYLSHRTVATHLYQIFPKLGVTSRAAHLRKIAAVAPVKETRCQLGREERTQMLVQLAGKRRPFSGRAAVTHPTSAHIIGRSSARQAVGCPRRPDQTRASR
jgi:DNA-binding CsgD family transcriptional regulator